MRDGVRHRVAHRHARHEARNVFVLDRELLVRGVDSENLSVEGIPFARLSPAQPETSRGGRA